ELSTAINIAIVLYFNLQETTHPTTSPSSCATAVVPSELTLSLPSSSVGNTSCDNVNGHNNLNINSNITTDDGCSQALHSGHNSIMSSSEEVAYLYDDNHHY